MGKYFKGQFLADNKTSKLSSAKPLAIIGMKIPVVGRRAGHLMHPMFFKGNILRLFNRHAATATTALEPCTSAELFEAACTLI